MCYAVAVAVAVYFDRTGGSWRQTLALSIIGWLFIFWTTAKYYICGRMVRGEQPTKWVQLSGDDDGHALDTQVSAALHGAESQAAHAVTVTLHLGSSPLGTPSE